jgi:hypothetical protein
VLPKRELLHVDQPLGFNVLIGHTSKQCRDTVDLLTGGNLAFDRLTGRLDPRQHRRLVAETNPGAARDSIDFFEIQIGAADRNGRSLFAPKCANVKPLAGLSHRFTNESHAIVASTTLTGD